jgi:hypothetical protein
MNAGLRENRRNIIHQGTTTTTSDSVEIVQRYYALDCIHKIRMIDMQALLQYFL